MTIGAPTATATELRFRIDEIDDQITQLLHDRRSVSHMIQRSRVVSGGARVDLSRENQVIQGYQTRLGDHGRDIAATVLTYCRGEINASNNEPQS